MKSLVKKVIPRRVFRKIEPAGHLLESVLLNVKNGFPASDLKIIGVTGTDGKTTTCTLIKTILQESGLKTAMITTAAVDYGDGQGEQESPTKLTTASTAQLHKLIKQVKANGVEWLVLEVSSHALAQHRVWGIPFYTVVMTNMSPEHLDYHRTFEEYRRAKVRLFSLCNKNSKGIKTGIINADDGSAEYFAAEIEHDITYGLEQGELTASEIRASLSGNKFQARLVKDYYELKSPLIGEFNIYNILAAIGAARAVGLNKSQIEHGVAALKSVPGRMMPISEGQDFKVLIDYAVTPAALENVLKTVRNLMVKGDIHIVFGATGDRDKTKRPKMGEVTGRLADFVYLTDDETYTENPKKIMKAVYDGVAATDRKKVSLHEDRRDAVETALKMARKDDVVIIAGIGHQTSRNMGGKKEHWSDIEVAREILKKA